jgi:hypothetical protein
MSIVFVFVFFFLSLLQYPSLLLRRVKNKKYRLKTQLLEIHLRVDCHQPILLSVPIRVRAYEAHARKQAGGQAATILPGVRLKKARKKS